MITKKTSYKNDIGWSAPLPNDLDSKNTMVLIFADRHFEENAAPIKEVLDSFPNSIVIGCSTAGEIFGRSYSESSISLSVTKFEKTNLLSSSIDVSDGINSDQLGKQLVQPLIKDKLKGVFLLSDGTSVNGSKLSQGINSILPEGVILTGGLAGDGPDFQSTWTIHNSLPKKNQIVAIAYYGDNIHVSHASKGGWDIFGVERTITNSKDNVLYTLDNQPALDLYKQYLGDRASELPSAALLFPLSIRSGKNSTESFVRTILSIDEKAKTMTFAGDVPQGSLAQLMRANFDRLIDGSYNAAEEISGLDSENNCLSIAISCVGRRLVLKERTEEEIEAILDVLPEKTEQIGFYSYGELSPLLQKTDCRLHNQTMTLTVLQED